VLTKQRRLPFPQQSSFRAKERLKLVHRDLCGPVTPATPGGRRYFLLLIDDLSCYMWVVVLSSKREATDAIRRAQASTDLSAMLSSHDLGCNEVFATTTTVGALMHSSSYGHPSGHVHSDTSSCRELGGVRYSALPRRGAHRRVPRR
jgi:hypothetical protein